jgi:hypothetical protein
MQRDDHVSVGKHSSIGSKNVREQGQYKYATLYTKKTCEAGQCSSRNIGPRTGKWAYWVKEGHCTDGVLFGGDQARMGVGW